ncbi:MAG: arginase family protein, partial [Coriobacteriales bacterium]
MPTSMRTDDPLWPRAGAWIRPLSDGEHEGDFALLGVPAHAHSISPSSADTTPAAVREALFGYSLYSASSDVDLTRVRAVDLGDVSGPDEAGGEERIVSAARDAAARFPLVVALGGDNSITCPLMRGCMDALPGEWGLITIDAHYDLRDGNTNGSPVRRLVEEAGLPGPHVVQIGIGDFSNSPAHALRAHEHGMTVFTRSSLRDSDLAEVATEALRIAGHGGRQVYVDIDVDVCDRAAVPACPSAAPGGLSADELRYLASLVSADQRVHAIDITEVDAAADAADGRTVRL